MFYAPPPPTPSDCAERTPLVRDLGVLGRTRATIAAGYATRRTEGSLALGGGLGLDLLRFESACRKATGLWGEEPVLRTSLGPFIDVAWSRGEALSYRGALQFAFGKSERSLVSIPLWEVFALAGVARVARAERTAVSFSLGGRWLIFQGEARVDVTPARPVTAFALFGLHFDGGAFM